MGNVFIVGGHVLKVALIYVLFKITQLYFLYPLYCFLINLNFKMNYAMQGKDYCDLIKKEGIWDDQAEKIKPCTCPWDLASQDSLTPGN